jgi:1-deoxy-D-xylulose-5-phosphate synthase
VPQTDLATVEVGRGLVRRQGKNIAVLVFGTLLPAALKAAEALNLTVADMRFVKPLDVALVLELAGSHSGLVTLEEGSIMGGAGSAVAEALAYSAVVCPLLQLGLPDRFIDHGEQGALLASVGLDAAGIEGSIRARFAAQLVT